jgi:hypothetical protein
MFQPNTKPDPMLEWLIGVTQELLWPDIEGLDFNALITLDQNKFAGAKLRT